MVIDNVHDNADAFVVQGLNHLLELVDSHFAVVGVGGVGAFGGVVVHRVIAPVELVGVEFGFVYAGVIIDGEQMHVGDA